MAEPSLGEITSIRGDADLSYGSPDGGINTVLPFSKGIEYLSRYAQNKMQADQFKYAQFQKNLESYMQDFDKVDVSGVMNKDYPELTKQWVSLAKDVYDNYDIIRNPSKDIEKYSELKQREADLRGKIAQSKQDLLYVDAHKNFIKADPSMNTDQNRSLISNFENGVLGGRDLFNLDIPTQYDPVARAKVAATVARQQLTEEQKKGKYLVKTDADNYLKDKFLSAWTGTLSAQDQQGRTVQKQAEQAYNLLPKQLTDGKSFDDIDKEFGLRFLPQDNTKQTQSADPFALQDDRQRFEGYQNKLNRALQRELAEDKTTQGVGRLYNEALTSAFTTGYVNPDFLQSIYGDNAEIELKSTSDVPVQDAQGNTSYVTQTAGSKVAKVKVTGTKLVGDKLAISREQFNEQTQKYEPLPDKEVDFDEARVAFTNVAGSSNAAKVSDAAQKYREKNNLGTNPDLPKLRGYFKFGQPGTVNGINLNADQWKK